jgi:hypothetical protein
MSWWWWLTIWWILGWTGSLACHYFLDEEEELTLGWLLACFALGCSGIMCWVILGVFQLSKIKLPTFKIPDKIVVWKWKK